MHGALTRRSRSRPERPGGTGSGCWSSTTKPNWWPWPRRCSKGWATSRSATADSTAALQALRDDPQRFAAVITDEVMPRLSGTQLTQALRSFAPQMPVLLVSGYGGALLAQRAAAAGVTRVLAKPLQRVELARVLAEALA